MNTLVLGALALLVLIGVAAVWIGGGGQIFSSFGNIIGGSAPSDISQAKTICQGMCNDLQTLQPTYSQYKNHKWCKKTVYNDGGTDYTCQSGVSVIGVSCTFTDSEGNTKYGTTSCSTAGDAWP